MMPTPARPAVSGARATGLLIAVGFLALGLASPTTATHVRTDELRSGGPPPDGIPAIRDPKFDDGSWLADDDTVIGVAVGDTARAYPYRILVWHEIANDVVEGRPIAATYCPLCGTGIVYDRTVDGNVTVFIVSGHLYKNDMVMTDLNTLNLWTQLEGESLGWKFDQLDSRPQIVEGDHDRKPIVLVPSVTTTWGKWKQAHPDTEVLSRDTGHARDYNRDPYDSRGYYRNRDVGVSGQTRQDVYTMHPKEMVLGLTSPGETPLALRFSRLAEAGVANIEFNATRLVATHDGGGVHLYEAGTSTYRPDGPDHLISDTGVRYDRATGRSDSGSLTRAGGVPSFWFAWFDFHPTTRVWGALGVRSLTPERGVGAIAAFDPISLTFTDDVAPALRTAAAFSTQPPTALNANWTDARTVTLAPANGAWPLGSLVVSVDATLATAAGITLGDDVAFEYAVSENGGEGISTPALPAILILAALLAGAAYRRRQFASTHMPRVQAMV